MNNTLLKNYLNDISKYQQLSLEEEVNLAKLTRQGDTEARRQLIEANLLLVVNIARQYLHPTLEFLDLIQEGNIGLIYAVDKFAPNLGCRFSTFAVFWIKKYIFLFLDKNFDDKLSLDMEIIEDYELIHLSDTIEDKSTLLGEQTVKNIDSLMEQKELQQHIRELLSTLNEREQEVLRLLFGIGLGSSLSVTEVSLLLKISKVRVCQLRDRALETLRNELETTD